MRYLPLLFLALALGAGCASETSSLPIDTVQEDAGDRRIEVMDVKIEGEGNIIVMPVVNEEVTEVAEDTGVAGDVTLELEMSSDNFSFSPNVITAKPGQDVAITFMNTGEHTFAIDEIGLNAAISNGSTVRFIAPTAVGNYRFYCSTGSHATLGMEGVLTIE